MVNGTTQAYVSGGSLTAEGNEIRVTATSTSTAAPTIDGLSGGLAAVAVMKSNAQIAGSTKAWAGGSTSVTAEALNLSASDTSQATPSTVINGGGAFTISSSDSLVNVTRETSAEVLSGADLNLGSGRLSVTATSTSAGTSETASRTDSAIDITLLSVTSTVDGTTRAQIQPNAVVRSSGGGIAVTALADNLATANTNSSGVGVLLDVGTSNPTAEVTATTEALALGQIIGVTSDQSAGNVVITATANDRTSAGSEASGGGLVSINLSTVTAKTDSTVHAAGGGTIRSGGNVTIQAISTSDADAVAKSASGGAVDVSDLSANVTLEPEVTAEVTANADISAADTLKVLAEHGQPPASFSDGSFNASAAGGQVDLSANTVTFGASTAC